MEQTSKINTYRQYIKLICRVFYSIAGIISLSGMVLLIVVDVVLRYVFNKPISSSHELIMYLLAVVVFSALSYATVENSHVMVELIITRFPRKVRRIIHIIMSSLGTALFFLIAEQSVVRGVDLRSENLVSAILHVPVYPFLFLVAFVSALMALSLLGETIESLIGGN